MVNELKERKELEVKEDPKNYRSEGVAVVSRSEFSLEYV